MLMNAHVVLWKHKVQHNYPTFAHPAYRGDGNNCTVRSLKNVFGVSLVRAYTVCQMFGRKHGHGFSWTSYHDATQHLAKAKGLKVERLERPKARRDYGKTIKTAQRRVGKRERVIFCVSGHTLSFRDGYTNDWADGRRHHLWEVWRITS